METLFTVAVIRDPCSESRSLLPGVMVHDGKKESKRQKSGTGRIWDDQLFAGNKNFQTTYNFSIYSLYLHQGQWVKGSVCF